MNTGFEIHSVRIHATVQLPPPRNPTLFRPNLTQLDPLTHTQANTLHNEKTKPIISALETQTHPLPMPNLLPRPLNPTLRPNIHQQVFLPSLPLFSFEFFFLLVTLDHGRCELGAEVGGVEGVELGEGGGGYLRVGREWVGLAEMKKGSCERGVRGRGRRGGAER